MINKVDCDDKRLKVCVSSDFLILMTLLKVDRSKVFESKNGYFQNTMINF